MYIRLRVRYCGLLKGYYNESDKRKPIERYITGVRKWIWGVRYSLSQCGVIVICYVMLYGDSVALVRDNNIDSRIYLDPPASFGYDLTKCIISYFEARFSR